MSHKDHYWLYVKSQGKPYLIYGGKTEGEARDKGIEILGGIEFDIKPFPTTNVNRASALLKGRKLEDTHSLSQASQRLGHGRSLRRLKRRFQQ